MTILGISGGGMKKFIIIKFPCVMIEYFRTGNSPSSESLWFGTGNYKSQLTFLDVEERY